MTLDERTDVLLVNVYDCRFTREQCRLSIRNHLADAVYEAVEAVRLPTRIMQFEMVHEPVIVLFFKYEVAWR